MTLPTILPTQGPDPYQFGKVNLGEKLGKGIMAGAKAWSKMPKKAAPEAPKEQLAIEHKPMLALPPGKTPEKPKPQRFVREAGNRAWQVSVPKRSIPVSSAQQRLADIRAAKSAQSGPNKMSPSKQRMKDIADKKQEWRNKHILKGATSIGTTRQNPGSNVQAAARFSGRGTATGGTPYNPAARTPSNGSASRVVRSPSGKPMAKPGAKPMIKPGSKPVQGGRPAPRNGRTR